MQRGRAQSLGLRHRTYEGLCRRQSMSFSTTTGPKLPESPSWQRSRYIYQCFSRYVHPVSDPLCCHLFNSLGISQRADADRALGTADRRHEVQQLPLELRRERHHHAAIWRSPRAALCPPPLRNLGRRPLRAWSVGHFRTGVWSKVVETRSLGRDSGTHAPKSESRSGKRAERESKSAGDSLLSQVSLEPCSKRHSLKEHTLVTSTGGESVFEPFCDAKNWGLRARLALSSSS